MEGIDTSNWRPFVIGDLFERLQLSVKSETFNKTLDVSEVRTEEFNLPLVNAKHGNNGIMFYGRENDFETAEMTIDIVQNGAIATGDVYAQPQRTGVLWDAYLIKPKVPVASEYTLMFLATVIEKAIKKHFSKINCSKRTVDGNLLPCKQSLCIYKDSKQRFPALPETAVSACWEVSQTL